MYTSGVERPSSHQRSSKMKRFITNTLSDFFFEYETPRQVLVRSRRVGVVCRLIQLGVLAYIIGWVFIYEKGYQSSDTAVGSVLTKVKGVSYTNVNGEERIWDVADYVFPVQGDSSFVVMTNYIMTKGQKMEKCSEPPNSRSRCSSDAECEGRSERTGDGHMTGKVFWSSCSHSRCNLVEGIDNDYVRNCLYDPKTSPLCPIFGLGDLVQLSGFNFSDIAKVGGAIGIIIDWTCNLDHAQSECKPIYSFHGLYGNPNETDEARASLGYNFSHWVCKALYGGQAGERTPMKVFGIRFDIIVRSVARKFDIIPTLTAIGSGVGIFGVATVVCDLILLHLLPKREFYNNMKFKVTEKMEKEPLDEFKSEKEVSKKHSEEVLVHHEAPLSET
ncbi:P2X purinoceptor 1-like [Salvelinus sp. IW2-2015]|uniref:P2X purinoceptor 1-like n=1 Tax=Salvelinus sp. IW2-2015 TaxID=2691554 RepID=UPI0038D514E1